MSIPSSGWSVPQTGWSKPEATPQETAPTESSGVPSSGWSVPQSGWTAPGQDPQAPQTPPKPQATPHDYDGIIKTTSVKYGLSSDILRMMGLQESGLGHGANYDPKTGRDKDGNKGVSPWQIDPASGLSAEEIDKAAKDPAYAADIAARMMKSHLAATHGDLRGALAMYNAGSATSPAGLKYADQVLAREQSLDPLHIPPEVKARAQWHVNHVVTALKQKDPMKAISRIPEMQAATHEENDAKQQWSWLKGHALEGIGDILQAPMRMVQDIETETNHAKGGSLSEVVHSFLTNDPKRREMLRHFNQAVWQPSASIQKRLNEGSRVAQNREMSYETHGRVKELWPSNAEVDHAIRSHIWKPAAGPTVAAAQTANEFAQQTMSDPLTLIDAGKDIIGQVPGLSNVAAKMGAAAGGHVQKALQAAGGVLRAAHNLMPKPVQDAYGHIPNWINAAEDTGNRLFGVRRDLDQVGFTREGKKMRMAIENRHMAQHGEMINSIKKVAHDPTAATDLYVNTARKAGVKPSQMADHVQILSDVTTSEEERADLLNKLARGVRNKGILDDTEKLVNGKSHLFAGQPGDLKTINVDRNQEIEKFMKEHLGPLHALSNIGKQAIMWNSLPHGLINEGTLTYMAGGLPAVMHGIKAMILPVADEDIKFLKDYGALPTHMLDNADPTNPVLRFGNAINHASQATLEHMELGWRVGLMKTLDKTMGPAKTEEEKLLRGWLINDKIGDYRNQNAFVNMFKILGGPFTAFHLGIVPKMFFQTLRDNPGRISQYQRMGQDIQNQQHPGQELSDSSPMAEGANMLAGLGSVAKGEIPSYVTDTLAFPDFEDKGKDDEGILQRLTDVAQHYVAPVGVSAEAKAIYDGSNRPGQHDTTLAEKLMDASLEMIGKHWKKPKTPKQEAIKHKEINRGDI